MTAHAEPLIGWRLWRVRDGRLRSWVVDQEWEPGVNHARCLAGRAASLLLPSRAGCGTSPGTDCQCGLWALWDLAGCVHKARRDCDPWAGRDTVIGLMAGWGAVAIHGAEGFRSQHGSVLCLFTDSFRGVSTPAPGLHLSWWTTLKRRLRASEPQAQRIARLRPAANRHGVPLLSLADAVRHGVLGELGVPGNRIREVEAKLATG